MNKLRFATQRALVLACTVLVIIGLQSCGSSDSDGRSTTQLFADPIDAQTLRIALTTGSAAGDDSEF